ncbi:hypothetical protein HK098_003502 [Nowakowskiella sp. JEL0407]|nr:hypothetical protein HK098_003502 [Nowakowskiella sp. JEL0407]
MMHSKEDMKSFMSNYGLRSGDSFASSQHEQALNIVSHLHNFRLSRFFMNPPRSIISIDIGLKNLAYAKITPESAVDGQIFRINEWKIHDLGFDLSNSSNVIASTAVTRFWNDQIRPLRTSGTLFISERQQLRGLPSGGVLHATHWVNSISISLFSLMHSQNVWNGDICPTAVANLLGYVGNKKILAVGKVNELIFEGKVDCDFELLQMWNQAMKKDDLADCLMQAITFYSWVREMKSVCLDLRIIGLEF